MGLATVVAVGISMGLGDYVSERAEQEYAHGEIARETWEFEKSPQDEFDEMMEIFTARFDVVACERIIHAGREMIV